MAAGTRRGTSAGRPAPAAQAPSRRAAGNARTISRRAKAPGGTVSPRSPNGPRKSREQPVSARLPRVWLRRRRGKGPGQSASPRGSGPALAGRTQRGTSGPARNPSPLRGALRPRSAGAREGERRVRKAAAAARPGEPLPEPAQSTPHSGRLFRPSARPIPRDARSRRPDGEGGETLGQQEQGSAQDRDGTPDAAGATRRTCRDLSGRQAAVVRNRTRDAFAESSFGRYSTNSVGSLVGDSFRRATTVSNRSNLPSTRAMRSLKFRICSSIC